MFPSRNVRHKHQRSDKDSTQYFFPCFVPLPQSCITLSCFQLSLETRTRASVRLEESLPLPAAIRSEELRSLQRSALPSRWLAPAPARSLPIVRPSPAPACTLQTGAPRDLRAPVRPPSPGQTACPVAAASGPTFQGSPWSSDPWSSSRQGWPASVSGANAFWSAWFPSPARAGSLLPWLASRPSCCQHRCVGP